jgi:hypothetical protein
MTGEKMKNGCVPSVEIFPLAGYDVGVTPSPSRMLGSSSCLLETKLIISFSTPSFCIWPQGIQEQAHARALPCYAFE